MYKNYRMCVAVFGMLAMAVAGCAGTGSGVSDADRIAGTLGQWKAALESGDIELAMTLYSDDYADPEGRGKAELQEFLTNAKEAGYLQGAEVVLEDTEVSIVGEEASAGPVGLYGSFGGIDLLMSLEKAADGNWLIKSADQY